MTPPLLRSPAAALVALIASGALLLGATPALAAESEGPLSYSHDAPAAEAPTDSAPVAAAEAARAADTYYNALSGGEELTAGESIVSTNGAYTFVLQADGNAVTYDSNGRPTWNTGTQGRGDHLAMQTDGNVVVYDAQDRPVWFTGTGGEPGAVITIQDDGNLVVYRADGSPAWASSVGGRIAPPAVSELRPGQTLAPGRQLDSVSGGNRAVMQQDGNFVVYGPGGALWSTGTSGPGNRLVMQSDGNAVIYGAGNSVRWASGTAGNLGATMVLRNDGSLVIAVDSGVIWRSVPLANQDTLGQGDSLSPDGSLTSSSGSWRATMQRDGNFVVYGPRGADFATRTSVPGSRFTLSRDGVLSVAAFQTSWTAFPRTYFGIGQPGIVTPYRLVMQNDGNLVEYDGIGRPVWASRGL
ncbi:MULTISPECIES: hypothetical protein [unclassified Rathayibacter]|uniref:hypothetical protein n=1 Tax=unclassified Rathayibacter TaxID=2609250 RepID=UPI0006F4B395|nr:MULTISPECIES: hypothetical protein [unclassified Rathayibacter]KQQ00806.1 hypothetical protein ASF42_15965 [Rathayibacter sp. Leaf294]KQS11007.1 hypothetical protein ASG06_15965 [Rathayibacter sp. Leaf185]